MTTLRREAIQIIINSINEYFMTGQEYRGEELPHEVAEKVVDSLSRLRGFSMLKPFEVEKAGIDWAIVSGADSREYEDYADQEIMWAGAKDNLESCLQIQLEWYPAKSSKERVMKSLRERILQWYTEDQNCFRDYQTWRTQPYSKGALSNVQIKSFPENFEASWSDFRRANPLEKKSSGRRMQRLNG